MAKKRRSSISLRRKVAMEVTRISVGDERLVYAMVADKKLVYPSGRSRVAYIGTTKNGIFRLSASIAERANTILQTRGVESFEVRIVTCHRRQRVKMWHRLEQAFLVTFRQLYGAPPICNSEKAGKNEGTVFDLFARSRVRRILEDIA